MSNFSPLSYSYLIICAVTTSICQQLVMSNCTTLTLSGNLHDNLTLFNQSRPRALIIRLASSALNSQAKYYPIPEEEPVIHTFLPLKLGLIKYRRAILKREQRMKAVKRVVRTGNIIIIFPQVLMLDIQNIIKINMQMAMGDEIIVKNVNIFEGESMQLLLTLISWVTYIENIDECFYFNQIDKFQQNNKKFFNTPMQQQPSLSIAKIKNIIKLQQLFHNKFLTIELVHELISLYTCCIEAIDQKQQEMRVYFLDKIQFVLSRPEVQSLLNVVVQGSESIVGNLRETLRVTQRGQASTHAKMQSLTPNFNRKRLNNYDGDNPDQKKKKIDLQLQIMNQIEQSTKNLSSKVQAADLKLQQQAKKIKNIAKQQNNRFEERLAKRKNKKVRKISADEKQQMKSPTKVGKKQLLAAQIQINEAVTRMTIRATQRMELQKMQEKQVKGRVKNLKRMESEEDG